MTIRYTLLYICALLLIMASGCSKRGGKTDKESKVAVDTIPMLVIQIQKCSRLYTAEYDIHKIITFSDEKRLKGKLFDHDFDIALPLGDRRIAIPLDAKLKAYIDFSQFSANNISHNGKKITVTLPDPRVVMTSSKVDQKGIKEFVDFTRTDFSDAEMTDLERQGRDAIVASIPQLGIIETAQENAARVLIPMIELMGFNESDITICYRHDFGEDDLGSVFVTNDKGR